MIFTPDSATGTPIEEADVLSLPTAPGLPPSILIPGEALGLHTFRDYDSPGDDIDALDVWFPPVVAPGPGPAALGVLAALLLGSGAALGWRRVGWR